MSYRLRPKKDVNYADDLRTDYYGTFGTFKININQCHIKYKYNDGLLIGAEATYPYIINKKCWVKFYPENNQELFFEKQIHELKKINGIEAYFDWVRSKYISLLPHYRNELCKHISFFKYSLGDIIYIARRGLNCIEMGAVIGEIEKFPKYDQESNTKIYSIRFLDLSKDTKCTLQYFYNVIHQEDELELVISALDIFSRFNNNPQTLMKYLQSVQLKDKNDTLNTQNQLLTRKCNVLSEMCFELCEHMLDVINQKWIVWMASRSFVNQYRSASTPSTRNMIKEKMIPYMQRQYGIPQTCWKETTNKIKCNLSLAHVPQILSQEALKNEIGDWRIFIADPIFEFESGEFTFKAHICDVNNTSKVINGDPKKKRERDKRQRRYYKEQRQFYQKLIVAYIRQNTSKTKIQMQVSPFWVMGIVLIYYLKMVRKTKVYGKYLESKNTN